MQRAMMVIGSACIVLAAGMVQGGQITVAGSSTVKPVVDKAAAQYKESHSETSFAIGGGGSSKGVKLAGEGKVMLGMASRDMKAKEKEAYPDVVPTKVGLDGIAIVTNKKNPVQTITKQQVADIYVGKITNWKDLGGNDAPIVLTAMGTSHGTHSMFLKYFGLEAENPGGDKKTIVHKVKGADAWADATARSVESSKEGMSAVMTNPNAIGYVSIGPAAAVAEKGAPIKLLELDGVVATTDNVANGSYPLCRSLYVLTKGQPAGEVAEFIEYLLGTDGQAIVAEHGYIPAKK
ncbi:MAG: solute-binding protein [Planctomycetes bacterium]|nr:phosphate ABC transporter substrate-binding protein [Phycisphaerae bacterium]NBB94602.1 solute-binding protein [Planctomycetota bacterium]